MLKGRPVLPAKHRMLPANGDTCQAPSAPCQWWCHPSVGIHPQCKEITCGPCECLRCAGSISNGSCPFKSKCYKPLLPALSQRPPPPLPPRRAAGSAAAAEAEATAAGRAADVLHQPAWPAQHLPHNPAAMWPMPSVVLTCMAVLSHLGQHSTLKDARHPSTAAATAAAAAEPEQQHEEQSCSSCQPGPQNTCPTAQQRCDPAWRLHQQRPHQTLPHLSQDLRNGSPGGGQAAQHSCGRQLGPGELVALHHDDILPPFIHQVGGGARQRGIQSLQGGGHQWITSRRKT